MKIMNAKRLSEKNTMIFSMIHDHRIIILHSASSCFIQVDNPQKKLNEKDVNALKEQLDAQLKVGRNSF